MSYSEENEEKLENNSPIYPHVGLFDGEIVKQRDDNAVLVKVYVTPQEHERLKVLCANRGGMSHVLRKLAVQWIETET